MRIIQKRKIWFLISGVFLIVGIVSLFLGGLRLGLDFRGGSFLEVEGIDSRDIIKKSFSNLKIDDVSIDKVGDNKIKVQSEALDEEDHKILLEELKKESGNQEIKELRFETVGPTISKDITRKAYISIILASLVIVLYVAWSFRKISKPVASWKYGVCAIFAVLHDVLFVLGAFSVLGMIFHIEVDSLFVTALMTIISFSVHDTIVIFDRVRENLKTSERDNFEEIVNDSVSEMIARSVNTSLVIIFVIASLFLLGGETIKYFVLAILLGMIVGTYSSLFIASPLLVVWKSWDDRRALKKNI